MRWRINMYGLNNLTKSSNKLYEKKTECCGCGGCAYVCPKDAIIMKQDYCGAYYPSIDDKKCIECNLCINACAFKEPRRNPIIKAYAAAVNNETQLHFSSSGGAFAAIAAHFLNQGDAVCGVMMDLGCIGDKIHHCIITRDEELNKLQGSKYGQSRVHDIYSSCEELLKAGKRILFTGTPCQVAEFKQLFKKYSIQIFTLDLICHGVPGNRLFDDYIMFLESTTGYRISSFVFRDKDYGWGHNGKYSLESVVNNGEEQSAIIESKMISSLSSSYYHYFLSGDIYRDSCYECHFASDKRVGDLTVGDYWGIEKYNPELLSECNGPFIKEKGISCILVNTAKGSALLQKASSDCCLAEVDIADVIKGNAQLNNPVELTKKREKIMMAYRMNGYAGIEKEFVRDLMTKKIRNAVSRVIPKSIKRLLKKISGL